MALDRVVLLFASGYMRNVSGNIFQALWLGTRYDLRELGILALIMMAFPWIPIFNPFKSSFARKFWSGLLGLLTLILVLLYIIDFIHFDYLAQRLNASVLNFLPEGSTSAKMVWQTYPVIKILLFLGLVVSLILFFIRRAFRSAAKQTRVVSKKVNVVSQVILFLVCALCIFGQLNQYPLRWSDAFVLGDSRLSQLALNPIQSFFSTMSFRHVTYDENARRKYYPMLASYLGVDPKDTVAHSYERRVAGTGTGRPNIVLVICESFSAYKSSMWGNPLHTTPYFNSLCDNGLFYDHCFTPHFGTARGVWATVTGIPDILLDKTASRDPLIVDQHTIINDFAGYEKDYFIGGSTSWANIKGVLKNNISGITIHEQDNYNAQKIDVWGISDKNLFLQANEALRKKTGPFFAVIQTSDNHRPYTIPNEDKDKFKTVSYPKDTLVKYGFQSNEELNAFRYTDFSFETFMEAARKEKYFSNTVFIFVGDHGIRGDAADMFPKAWTVNGLTCFHVPLLFYSPAILKPERHTFNCSQVDLLPTVAGIAGIPYTNTTMGRDLRQITDTASNVAFIIDHDIRYISAVRGKYFFQHQLADGKETLVRTDGNDPPPHDSLTQITNTMRETTNGFYETARYLLFHNAKAQAR